MLPRPTNSIKSFLLTLILCAIGYSQMAFATAQIHGLRITHPNNTTRFVFDLNQSVRFHYKYSSKPARLLLEINQASLACALPKSPLQGSAVKDYRAQTQNGGTNFSFDFKYPLQPQIYILSPSGQYGYRLVVDLKPLSGKLMPIDSIPAEEPKTSASIQPDQLAPPKKSNTKPAPPAKAAADQTTAKPDNQEQTPAASPALTFSKPTSKHPIMVVIDPGHGGKDPGAAGPAGSKEKNIVLAISKQVQKLLNQDPHYRARLTRSTDIYIPLRQRLYIARTYKPDLFVAIHADAAYKNSAVGASVFALSERGATSEMARWLAQKENASELVDGVFVQKDRVLRSVLLDLSQSHAITVSLEIGQAMLRQLSTITHLHYGRVEQAAFVVLKSPDIPSLLVETGYVTNPAQERQLNDPAYQKRLAQAIVQGIKDYFSHHS